MGKTVLENAPVHVEDVIMSMVCVILDAYLAGQGTFVKKVKSNLWRTIIKIRYSPYNIHLIKLIKQAKLTKYVKYFYEYQAIILYNVYFNVVDLFIYAMRYESLRTVHSDKYYVSSSQYS